VENVTLLSPPKTVGIDEVDQAPQEENSGIKGWMIGLIVAGVLIVLPVPGGLPLPAAASLVLTAYARLKTHLQAAGLAAA
jgi:hypothetical protein